MNGHVYKEQGAESKRIKMFRFVAILALIMNVHYVMYAQDQVNFDSLFYESSYKKVFDGCMQLYAELDLLKERIQTQEDCLLAAELVLGKLMLVQRNIAAMVDSKHYISTEDLAYLLDVIHAINKEALVLFNDVTSDCKELLVQLFTTIKQSIEKKLGNMTFNE